MTAREMEDLIAEFPNDFYCFRDKGLTLIGRQQTLPGFGRYDLLFEDCFHTKIVMELKARPLSFEDRNRLAGQITNYQQGIVDGGGTNIAMFVVAVSIPKTIQRFLEEHEIWCYEIREPEFRRVAKQHCYSCPAEEPRSETSAASSLTPRRRGGGIRFIEQRPLAEHTFQWVYVPLVRNEFSISELADLLLRGLENRVQDDTLFNKLIGAGITNRSEEGTKLKKPFRAGIFVSRPDIGEIRNWIIGRLKKGVGLDLTAKYPFYLWFTYVKYTTAGAVVNLNQTNVESIEDDEPIRIICRPKWFDDCGDNRGSEEYYGGRVQQGGRDGQQEFYSANGSGGRFPLRRGTPVPGDV